MTADFFKFTTETTKENFSKSQQLIFSENDYDPYSDDLSNMEQLLDEGKFQEVVDYGSINILLSPRAHLFKNYALRQLKKVKEAQIEMRLSSKILQCIKLSGAGTKEEPYLITRISDEKDFLDFIHDRLAKQSLFSENDKYYDLITTISKKEIYFDITIPYLKLSSILHKQ